MLTLSTLLLFCSAAVPQEAITNTTIIKMVGAGLGSDVVIGAIRGAKAVNFDVSADALIALKRARVADPIIAAMQERVDSPARSSAAPAFDHARTPAAAGNPITAPHEPGIYVDLGERTPQLEALEPTRFNQGKSGGLLGSVLTHGIKKANWKAVVNGGRAQLRLHDGLPVFYFYFETKSSGLASTGGFAGWMAGATSPNEFVLARLKGEKSERTLIIGEAGLLGASSGTRSQDTVEMRIERLAPGVYRVTPASTLTVGEYCFFYAAGAQTFGAATVGKLFDFGIDPAGTAVRH
jgi:hypothetical protein